MSSYVLPLILFVFMGGLVMQWPVTQHMIVERACERRFTDEICANLSQHPDEETEVQSEASHIMILQSVFCDIPGSVASLILGAQSDKVGRKRIMLMPVIGSTLLNAILFLSTATNTAPLLALLSSSVVLGVSGGIGTFMTAVTNYITDSTPEEKRTEALSKNMPFMGLGLIVGMILSGVLTDLLGVSAVYFIVLVIMIFTLYLVVFQLEESLPNVEKVDGNADKDNPPKGVISLVWSNLTAGIRVFSSQKDPNIRLQLLVVVLSGMISMAAAMAEGNLLMLYTKKSPFVWSPSMYAIHTAGKQALGIVGQALGTFLFFKVMGERSIKNDFRLLQMSSMGAVAINLMTGYATSTSILMISIVMVTFITPAQSAAGSITSKLVSPSEKGAFMSLGTFLNTLAVPAMGFVCNSIYSYTVQSAPGFVFIVIASLHTAVLAAVTYVIFYTLQKGSKEEKTE